MYLRAVLCILTAKQKFRKLKGSLRCLLSWIVTVFFLLVLLSNQRLERRTMKDDMSFDAVLVLLPYANSRIFFSVLYFLAPAAPNRLIQVSPVRLRVPAARRSPESSPDLPIRGNHVRPNAAIQSRHRWIALLPIQTVQSTRHASLSFL